MKSVVRWMLRATFSPPRCTYKANEVVSVITTNSQVYNRTIFEFLSPKGEKIMSSLWRDQSNESPKNCMIYLHSLGANQFEAVNIIPLICTKDLSIVTFDFPGCGLSGGTILPLDGSGPQLVKSCVDYLTQNYHFTEFAIWGRSMGAAVALHTVSIYPEMFKCIVADSSFACTEKILKDQGRANGFPSFIIKMLMPVIKKEAKEDLKTKVDVPFPIEYIPKAKAPLLQGHGNKDRFVPCEHAKLIFNEYGGSDKQLNFFEGKHNSPRPNSWYETVCRFMFRHLNIDERPRCYDSVYFSSKLHVGPVEQVLPDVLRVNEVLKQREMKRNLRKSLLRHASNKLNNDLKLNQKDNQENDSQENDSEYDKESEKDNDYDYDYDYDQNENENKIEENTANESEDVDNTENQANYKTNPNSIFARHSSLIPGQDKHVVIGEDISIKRSYSQCPIEDSYVAKIKNEHEMANRDIVAEKKIKKNEKRKHKVWFDSLSEIGTDIDLGEKIENANREEEMRRREEMLNSIKNGNNRIHRRHRHRHIPLGNTRHTYAKTRSDNTNINPSNDADIVNVDDKINKKGNIKKAASALMEEIPLDSLSES